MSLLKTVMLGALLLGGQLGEAGFFGDGNWHIGNWFSCTRVYKEKSSFHDSCVACVMAFCQVSCTCRRKNGNWHPTTHNALSCGGPGYMWNQDGRLTCHHDPWADWAGHNPDWNRRIEAPAGTEAARVAERLEFAIEQPPASVNATAVEESVKIKLALVDELIEMFAETIEEESPFVRHSIRAAVEAKIANLSEDENGRFAVCELFELDDCAPEMAFTRDEFEEFATRLLAAMGNAMEAVESGIEAEGPGTLEN